MAAKLKKGDKVIVLAGKDKGKEGEVLSINPSTTKAVVRGINVAVRHVRQDQNTQGGRVPQDMPIHLSNLAVIDPDEGGPTRVGFKMDGETKKRFAKKSGAWIDG